MLFIHSVDPTLCNPSITTSHCACFEHCSFLFLLFSHFTLFSQVEYILHKPRYAVVTSHDAQTFWYLFLAVLDCLWFLFSGIVTVLFMNCFSLEPCRILLLFLYFIQPTNLKFWYFYTTGCSHLEKSFLFCSEITCGSHLAKSCFTLYDACACVHTVRGSPLVNPYADVFKFHVAYTLQKILLLHFIHKVLTLDGVLTKIIRQCIRGD